MNLSLYLLLAAENEPEFKAPTRVVNANSSAQLIAPGLPHSAKPLTSSVYEPCRHSCKALHQASYRQSPAAQSKAMAFRSLGFSASVLGNTCGFLLITAGLFILLQIAQVSLG